MTQSVPADVSRTLAWVVDQRIGVWQLVSDLIHQEPVQLAPRLTDGSWGASLTDQLGWIGDGAQRVAPALTTLAQAVQARPLTADEIHAARSTLVAPDLAPLTHSLRTEQDAWQRGTTEQATQHRRAQHEQLGVLSGSLQQWALGLDAQTHSPGLRAVAPVVLQVLSIETGRDFASRFRPQFRLADLLREL